MSVFFCFPELTNRVNFDSDIVAEKLWRLLANIETPEINVIDVSFSSNINLIVKDGLILVQTKTESSTTLPVFHLIVDLACNNNDWIAILHAAGGSWQGHGMVFPAQEESGKTPFASVLYGQPNS